MATANDTMAVGIFDREADADRAVIELRELGFPEEDIGEAGGTSGPAAAAPRAGLWAVGGLLLGAAAMAGYAVTWVLVFDGAVWTAYVGGALAAGLAAVAAVWAVVEFVRMSLARRRVRQVAPVYESDLRAGRAVVTVCARGRYDDAVAVLRRHGSHEPAAA